MSFRKLLMAGAVALSLIAGFATVPAQAAGPWQGFYAGLQAGYGWSQGDSFNQYDLGQPDGFGRKWNTGGAAGGGFAGFNGQTGRFVAGLEGDAGVADLSGGFSVGAATFKQNILWTASVRPRAGYLVLPRLLLYGTGGVAAAGIHESNIFGAGGINDTKIRFGWTAGGGAEYHVWQNWHVRAEYRYTDYGSPTFSQLQFNGFSEKISATSNTVQFGVSYKFF